MSGGSTRTATVTASLCALRTPPKARQRRREGRPVVERCPQQEPRGALARRKRAERLDPLRQLQRGQRLLQGAARRRERSHPHGGGQPQLAALGELTLGEPGRVPADQRLHSRDRRVARRAAENGNAALGSPPGQRGGAQPAPDRLLASGEGGPVERGPRVEEEHGGIPAVGHGLGARSRDDEAGGARDAVQHLSRSPRCERARPGRPARAPRPSAGPRRLPSAAVGRRTARTRRPPWSCRTSGTTEQRRGRGARAARGTASSGPGHDRSGRTARGGTRGGAPARAPVPVPGPLSRCARRWTGGGRSPPRGRARARRPLLPRAPAGPQRAPWRGVRRSASCRRCRPTPGWPPCGRSHRRAAQRPRDAPGPRGPPARGGRAPAARRAGRRRRPTTTPARGPARAQTPQRGCRPPPARAPAAP